MTSSGTGGPAQRLVELLEQLPPEERREIMAWLLEHGHNGPSQGHPQWPLPALLPAMGGGQTTTDIRIRRLTGTLPTGEDSQLVTIRLPAERHAELRAWCTEHGFTMAAVIRGLVERFLEEHGTDKPDLGP